MISRYSRPEMASLWSPEARLRRWRDIELFALEAMVKLGLATEDALAQCREKAGDFTEQDVARIDEIERTTKHDVIAFLTFLEERIGPAARWLHVGMTSSDVLDTALGATLRDAADLLLEGVDRVMKAVRDRAFEHKRTLMIGRSHGVHAEPITFGHKLAIWYDELQRNKARLVRAKEAVAVGKISGAVGTFAHLPPYVEEHVCRRLGLAPAPASNQIIQRDRHAQFFATLAILGSSIEKFATEIRHLQRTEVREVEEPFTEGQKGYSVSALENISLWHERDISHSSVERVIAPDGCIVADFMLDRFARLVEQMRVYPEQMRENLGKLGGVIYSQAVLLALARKGLNRQAAYALVQRNAMKVYDEGVDFETALLGDPEVLKVLSAGEISACFALDLHARSVDEIFDRVFGKRAKA